MGSAGEQVGPARPRLRGIELHPSFVALALTVAGLAAGAAAWLAGSPLLTDLAWGGATVTALVPLVLSVARDLRRGRVGVDVIALLAMAGALALGEYLAGAVIALMLSGGQALERFASARARRELAALTQRAPRVVHRYEDGALTAPAIDEVRLGDRLLVKPGEVVPVDGAVVKGTAVIDEAALTGEARLVERGAGDVVRSGTVNAGGPFDVRAVATAEQSTYAGIVRLTREAQASKAPLVRLADRYALFFLPLTLVVAAGAWIYSGDPVRALAVLVVATPCPLILAAPIAIVSGISRAASRGIIVKGGGALEALAEARTVLFDKTGTLTMGTPAVTRVETFAGVGENELVRLAASLDQVSPHVLAAAIVAGARERGLGLSFPEAVREVPGRGVEGSVGGRRVGVGKAAWLLGHRPLPEVARRVRRQVALDGHMSVFVAVDGELAGALILEDRVRRDTPRALMELRAAGIRRVLIVTGDQVEVARTIGRAIGADDVLAERKPGEKLQAVRAEAGAGKVVMVGDGINDAPALAAADVGVAMGARGATASSEAADVVITVDRLDRLAEAVSISRRARGIALQSIFVGMGLSAAAMLVAAAGRLPPVEGAVLQEAIDVVVILNALRALRTPGRRRGLSTEERSVRDRIELDHEQLVPAIEQLRLVADGLGRMTPAETRTQLERLHRFLVHRLLPHEAAEAADAFPLIVTATGERTATDLLHYEHGEIEHLVSLLSRLLAEMPRQGPSDEELNDLRRVLYGLYAILRLHFAEEDRAYLPLPGFGEGERGRTPAAPPARRSAGNGKA